MGNITCGIIGEFGIILHSLEREADRGVGTMTDFFWNRNTNSMHKRLRNISRSPVLSMGC